ncbi:MAG TPA: sugar phosphate isomerase/epimerase [Methanosarcinales archaeon]|nr:sugar phosphate isomerase/epimerase [Methanosarcinales archaeon]
MTQSRSLPSLSLRDVSFSSLCVTDDPFAWAHRLEDIGFGGWEVVQEGKQVVDDRNIGKMREVCHTTDLAITIHLPFSDLNLASMNQPIWEEVMRQHKSCIRIASEFADLMVVHPGYLSPIGAQMPDLAWQQNITGLQQLCDFASDFGVKIAVENMPRMELVFGREPGEMAGMIELADRENLGMTLDLGHAHTTGTLSEFLLMKEVVHVHVHDNKGRRDEHLPIGAGTIAWDPVISELRKRHRGCRFVIEARSLAEGSESLERLREMGWR